jgi:hypothetical protein
MVVALAAAEADSFKPRASPVAGVDSSRNTLSVLCFPRAAPGRTAMALLHEIEHLRNSNQRRPGSKSISS